ncbi:MAG TPA: hypothetical protein DDY04_05550 [Bacteroidales bacterium]|nr:hypothetical protein [Bacteroidales bacterium]
MSAKKIITLTILIAAIGIGIFYFFRWYRHYNQSNFSIKSSGIRAVELVKEPDTLRLANSHGIWYLNDFYYADSASVEQFIHLLRTIKPIAPATLKIGDDMTQLLKSKAIQVRIFGSNSLLREFLIASIPEFNYKPVAFKGGFLTPYYVESTVATDDLIEYFSLNPDSWLASKLFTEPLDDVIKIKVDFLQNQKGYTIRLDEDSIILLSSTGSKLSGINLANVSSLYYSFNDLKLKFPCENDILSAKPENIIVELQIEMISGETYKYTIYRITGKDFTNILGQKLEYDPNRLLIKMNNNRFLIGTYLQFHYILCTIDEYVNNSENS